MIVVCGVQCAAPCLLRLQPSSMQGLQVTYPRYFSSSQFVISRCSTNSQSRPIRDSKENNLSRISRRVFVSPVLLCLASVLLGEVQATPELAIAEEAQNEGVEQGGTLDRVLSFFDPNEMTKSGKKLPKGYVKSVKEVVKSLRDSFNEDSKDDAKFRRNADSAKEAIRGYLQNWRGAKVVATEDSYLALEQALRILGEFYSKKGPRAALPEDIRTRILADLSKADDSL